MSPLEAVGWVPAPPAARAAEPAARAPSEDFSRQLDGAVGSLLAAQADADRQAARVAMGGGGLHEAVLAAEKADLSLRLAVRVRNRFVDAYQEVMRMSV